MPLHMEDEGPLADLNRALALEISLQNLQHLHSHLIKLPRLSIKISLSSLFQQYSLIALLLLSTSCVVDTSVTVASSSSG